MRRPRKATFPETATVGSAADLGALIRAARRKAGIPLDEAAQLVGVSKQFLTDLERGKPTVQLDRALSVAREFGIELHYRPRGLGALRAAPEGTKEPSR